MIIKETYFQQRVNEEEKWIYRRFYSTKSIILNILTFGLYGMAQYVNYQRRIGLK